MFMICDSLYPTRNSARMRYSRASMIFAIASAAGSEIVSFFLYKET